MGGMLVACTSSADEQRPVEPAETVLDSSVTPYEAWIQERLAAAGSEAQVVRVPASSFASPRVLELVQEQRLPIAGGAVADVDLGPDGAVYLLDTGNDRIVGFSREGDPLDVIPGERFRSQGLSSTRMMAVAQDTVAVIVTEAPAGRMGRPDVALYVLRRDAEVPHRVTLPPDLRSIRDFRYTAAGWTVSALVSGGRGSAGGAVLADTFVIARLDWRDSIRAHRVLAYPLAPFHELGRLRWNLTAVFAAWPQHAITYSGEVYAHGSAGYAISHWSATSVFSRQIVAEVEPIRTTVADVEQALEERLSELRSRSQTAAETQDFIALLDSVGPHLGGAHVRPVLGAMLASDGGWLLVARVDAAARGEARAGVSVWEVIDPDGRLHGRFEAPEGVRLRAVAWPLLYGIAQGAGELRIYRITPDE